MFKKIPSWLVLTFASLLLNGVWGALIEIPEKRISPGFPTSLGFIVWSIAFIPCSIFLLYKIGWKLDYSLNGIKKGMLVGLLGAGGQFVIFEALRSGPAYIIFPITSVFPIITIVLSIFFLKERINIWASLGIVFAFISMVLLSLQESGIASSSSYTWLLLSIGAFLMWGLQAFFAKVFLQTMNSESIFFYIMVSNLVFIPLALKLTDFTQPIGWGTAFYVTIAIQLLNVIGVVTMVFALSMGKVIVISPVSSLAPMITTILSLFIYSRIPYVLNMYGILIALISLGLVTYGEVVSNRNKASEILKYQ
ncbi:MAG: DMT family transporter [Bacteroidota bacterium]|nr:DMT family transporter [Bacteroidota bacterium]